MKRLLSGVLVLMLVLTGCSKKSVNDEAVVSFKDDYIEKGTTYTKAGFVEKLVVENLKEGTVVDVVFAKDSASMTFDEAKPTTLVVTLTLDDDVREVELMVDVKDTIAPIIRGAVNMEVGVGETLDLKAVVSTQDPTDTLTFSPETVDTSVEGTTAVRATATDGVHTVNATFNVSVVDVGTAGLSKHEHYGQTYGNLEALSVGTNEILVNKIHALEASYVPANLVTVSSDYAYNGRSIQVVKEAYDAFVEMNNVMMNETGMSSLGITSAYRSYGSQRDIYNSYVNSDGKEAADTYSARPGYSEHQTGLAMDIDAEGKILDDFIYTNQSDWVAKNAARFGFIIRFPEGKDRITGYQYECWHIRYVGKALAKAVYDSGLTYDEYYVRNLLAQ